MSPTQAVMQKEKLHYSVGSCSVGSVFTVFVVARGGSGICALLLGEGEAELHADLAQRFPHRRICPAEEDQTELLAKVTALLEGRRDTLGVSLAPQGTAFQLKVWQALRAVAPGNASTYTQLAQSLGLPATAVRAVAGACAANPCAVAIPCHRVVRGDGGLAGYRWGVERKRALLQREADQALAAQPFCLVPQTPLVPLAQ